MPRDTLFNTDALKSHDAPEFQGRRELLERGVKTLKNRTQTCIVFGERGIGKTSFAWQLIALLEGSVPSYVELRGQLGLENLDHICILVKGLSAPSSVEELLIQAIAPSDEANSLFSKVPELYQDAALAAKLRQRYEVDFTNFALLDVFAKVQPTPDLVFKLFNDVMRAATEKRPESRFLFFVDEADLMTRKDGIGRLIKNTDYARFIFVGIADTVEQIVNDHLSATRKFIGGELEVPPLGRADVRAIFDGAERLSGQRVVINEKFKKLAVKYCGGFPWIAQHLGNHAVDEDFYAIMRRAPEHPKKITDGDFRRAWPIVRQTYARLRQRSISLDALEDSETAQKVAIEMLKVDHYLTVDELLELTGVAAAALETNIARLIAAGLIVRRPNHTVRFEDPIVRAFVLEWTENHGNSKHT